MQKQKQQSFDNLANVKDEDSPKEQLLYDHGKNDDARQISDAEKQEPEFKGNSFSQSRDSQQLFNLIMPGEPLDSLDADDAAPRKAPPKPQLKSAKPTYVKSNPQSPQSAHPVVDQELPSPGEDAKAEQRKAEEEEEQRRLEEEERQKREDEERLRREEEEKQKIQEDNERRLLEEAEEKRRREEEEEQRLQKEEEEQLQRAIEEQQRRQQLIEELRRKQVDEERRLREEERRRRQIAENKRKQEEARL